MSNLLANPEERVFFKDLESRFLLVSAAWLAAVGQGRTLDQVIGKTDFDIFSAEHARAAFEDEQSIIASGESMVAKVERETFHNHPDAWVSTAKGPLRDSDGNIAGTWGTSRDITAQVKAEQELAYQSQHDSVTGLANRVALTARLTAALSAREGHRERVALLFVDLNSFKDINDSLGQAAGNRVLSEVGQRLTQAAHQSEEVAHIGGGEFVLLYTALTGDDELQRTSEQLVAALKVPLQIAGRDLTVSCGLGAVVSGDPQADPDELLRQVSSAIYSAKHSGRNRFEVLDVEANAGLAGELRQAIKKAELFVAYQPVFRLDDGTITGAETLVRWAHPQRGLVPPGEFIPLAEERGMIGEIGTFVLDEACRQLAEWRRRDDSWDNFVIGVNVSCRELNDPELVDRVAAALSRYALPPARLCLEITETALIDEIGDAHQVLAALAALGVRLALDDFGTGHSTLTHLQQLPADTLKIDRSFVAQIGEQSRDREIVAAVIAMTHALGMYVVGEGIETDEQLQKLLELGCDKGQGYIFAPPLTPDELIARRESTSSPSMRA